MLGLAAVVTQKPIPSRPIFLYKAHFLGYRGSIMVSISTALGFTANIMSNFAFLPQIIKSVKTKSVDDISIGMFVILFTTQLCWIGYAIPLHARQLWTSSLIEILLLLPIFVLWFKYRNKKPGLIKSL